MRDMWVSTEIGSHSDPNSSIVRLDSHHYVAVTFVVVMHITGIVVLPCHLFKMALQRIMEKLPCITNQS